MEQLSQWIAIIASAVANLAGFVFLIGRQTEHLRQVDTRMDQLTLDVREVRGLLIGLSSRTRRTDA